MEGTNAHWTIPLNELALPSSEILFSSPQRFSRIMADGWSIARSCIGTCTGAFSTLCSWFTSFLPPFLRAPLTEFTALMRDILRTLRDIHGALRQVNDLLRLLLEEVRRRPPARENPREWEITMTGQVQPRLRREVASASGQS